MSEYQANSHRSKAESQAAEKEPKKIQKVVNSKPKTRKNEGRNLMNIFISEDAGNVKSHIFMDILVPAVKKAISDIVRDGIDMILYGETGSRKNNSGSRVSYRSYYDDKREGRRETESRARGRFDYDDIIFDSRGEAEAVLKQMKDVIVNYDWVTVADMYDMADITAPYTGNKYGWSNLRGAEVLRVRDGYIIKLPKANPID